MSDVRTPGPAAVSIFDAVVVLGGFPALAGVSVEVHGGESVLVSGPNGAGKSTFLRLCAGLQRLHSGSGHVLGCDLAADRRELRRRVAFVGHQTMLYDELTVAENLRFWSKAARIEQRQVDAAVARLEIDARLHDVLTSRLSAGQRRRVALALAAARRPSLWLLDEPHASLDADGRDIVDGLIREATAAGAAVIVASHELERVADVVDRTVHLAGGTAQGVRDAA